MILSAWAGEAAAREGTPARAPAAVTQAPAQVAASPPSTGVLATAARLDALGDMTRLVFDIAKPIDVTAFVLTDPDRVVVELPEVNFQIDPAIGQAPRAPAPPRRAAKPAPKAPAAPLAGVVKSYRFGLFAPGKSRVVIDLAEPARVARAAVETDAIGGSRLVIELVRAERGVFLAAARTARPVAALAPSKPPAPIPATAMPVVVIDPGHGGVDDGAHGLSGSQEKDIVLEFARALAARIVKAGQYKAVLTRSTDVFIPLGDRVKIAQEAGAALFISIHADTLADEPKVVGATVYTVSDKASDAEAARLAEKENQSDAIAGVEGQKDGGEVADILFDLTRRETRSYSHVFARTLVEYFGEVGRLNKNARRSAGFRVLKAPDVPSVLLELGYLSSDKDAANLVSAEWRERAAGAVASAVDRFFKSRGEAAPKADGGDSASMRLKASFNAAGRE